MKQERILYALGGVADEYIAESMPVSQGKNRAGRWFMLCAAAVLILIAGSAVIRTMNRETLEEAEAELEPAEIQVDADSGGEMAQVSSGDERFVDVHELIASAGGGGSTETEDMVMRTMQISVDGYTAIYEGVDVSDRDMFSEMLYASKGAALSEESDFYYVSGHTDKQYLIQMQDTELSLWKFLCFDAESYSYRDVLEGIYGVYSADGIAEVIVSAGNMDNTAEGLRIQQEIGTLAVTDREDIAIVYQILSGMTCYGMDNWDKIQTGSRDADASGAMKELDEHQEVRMTRYLTIVTPYNEIDSLKYTAASGMFYEFNGIAYEALLVDDAKALNRIFRIDETGTGVGSATGELEEVADDITVVMDEERTEPVLEENAPPGIYEQISAAMARGELPFVVSSSFQENVGKIVVTVTTQDEALLSRLRAYDPDGGVLQIEYDPDGGAVQE